MRALRRSLPSSGWPLYADKAGCRMSIPFIDLKTQYAALKQSIDARIQRVLDHGQYIMGPEVAELESSARTIAQNRFSSSRFPTTFLSRTPMRTQRIWL